MAADRYIVAPLNEPRLVTNWEQFKTQFGDFQTGNLTLAHAVYGFFNNGGTRCHVVRITSINNSGQVTTALQKFESIDEIAIVAAPGALSNTVQDAVINHCKNMQDRFAIIDGQATTTITVNAIKGPVGNSDYALCISHTCRSTIR